MIARRELALIALSSCVAGCPGSLGDINRFVTDGATTLDATFEDRVVASRDTPIVTPADVRDGGSLPGACPSNVDVDRDIIQRRCAVEGCHAAVDPQQGLDLASPGVARRLVGVTSRCRGMPLVVMGDSDAGFFLHKLTVPRPSCGGRMPPEGPLNAQEIACVRAWVASLNATGGGR